MKGSRFFNKEVSRMKSLSITKRLAVAAVAAAALAGPVTAAHALQFNQGDAVLAVYGNTTEYVANLGSFSNLVTNGVNHDLSGFLGTIGPTTSLKYTIVGYQGTGIYFGDRDPASSFTAQQKNQVLPNTLISALTNWNGPLASTGNTANLFAATDPLSFSSNLNAAGSDTLGASVPSTHPGATAFNTTLNLLQRTGAATTLATVGTAFLGTDGHFVVSAVPIPAAAVLFATGIVGLIGVARRRVFGLK
jgi:hypothetical protein